MISALTCPMPENINPLYTTNFIFSVHKVPSLTYFVQGVDLPTLTLGEANVSTPLVDVPVPGDKLTFSNLNVTFLVDEKFQNYKLMSEWIIALGYPENHTQFTEFQNKQQVNLTEHLKTVSDATLGILDSSNNPLATYTFIDCFPVSLSGFSYATTNTEAQVITASATFAFSHYNLRTKYDT